MIVRTGRLPDAPFEETKVVVSLAEVLPPSEIRQPQKFPPFTAGSTLPAAKMSTVPADEGVTID